MSLLTELGNIFACGCYKDFAPTALGLVGFAARVNDRERFAPVSRALDSRRLWLDKGVGREQSFTIQIFMDDSENFLTIELKNTRPVELLDFTSSLSSLADEYNKRIIKSDPEFGGEIRLYIKEIKAGSIIARIQEMMPYAMPFVGDAKSLNDFCKSLKSSMDWLRGIGGTKPERKHTYENVIRLVEPVAKDNGSILNIGKLENNAPINITNITINNLEANAVQNAARRELDAIKQPVTGFKENMVIYWYQARNDAKSQRGDRTIIEAIWPSPVKTVFATESIKAKMLLGDEYPFASVYLVDVQVQAIGERPVLYTIINFRERLDEAKPVFKE